jgi:zinc protease
MILDRTIPPAIHTIESVHLPSPEVIVLDNGIKVIAVNTGMQDIIKFEIVHFAGRLFETKKGTSRSVSRLLRDGTKDFSSKKIAETLDFYAAGMQSPVNLDYNCLSCYTLTKHFDKLAPIISQMISAPSFPKTEIKTYITNSVQQLKVDIKKNDSISFRTITEKIFGAAHPYGYNSTKEMYEALHQDDLNAFFQDNYRTDNASIFLAGKYDTKVVDLINTYFGQNKIDAVKKEPINLNANEEKPAAIKIIMPDSFQNSIRIGRRLFTRSHPDFSGFFLVSTILGGYFGSRLMKNIREEKGYTYNIYSGLDPMYYDGYFYIDVETDPKYSTKVKKEIYKEMDRLQNELIGEDELLMAKNYTIGNLLNSVDGPFNTIDTIKTFTMDNLPITKLNEMIVQMRNMTAIDIQILAQKYLSKTDFWEIEVGI